MHLVLDRWTQARATRSAVIALISRKGHPHRDDLIAAMKEIPGEPVPQRLVDYVCKVYVKGQSRPTGTRPRVNPAAGDTVIPLHYHLLCDDLQAREQTREIKGIALAETAREYGVSVSTVKRLVLKRKERLAAQRFRKTLNQ